MSSHLDLQNVDRVPILIGIIGHRDLVPEQRAETEEKVASVFKALQKKFKNTPFFLVCSLAEGADMLGAKVATEMGIKLVALLPMEPAEYKQTFKDPASGPLLDQYLKIAEVEHVCKAFDPDQPGSRDDQFARAGAAVMQYSHLVIALWDGATNDDLTAGTAFLVRHAIKGIPRKIVFDLEGSSVSPLDPVSTACVRRIPTERISNRNVQNPVLLPEGKFEDIDFSGPNSKKAKLKLEKSCIKMFKHFDRFNKDAARFKPKSGKKWSDVLGYDALVPKEDAEKLNKGLQYLRERFALADTMAIHFQKNRHVVFMYFIILLTAVITFVHQLINSKMNVHNVVRIPSEVEERLPGHNMVDFQFGWPYIVYGMLILTGLAMVYLFRGKRWRERYLDYRTIAEATRVQFYWLLAGIRPPVVHSFLRKQQSELEWIRSVVRMWYLRAITWDGYVKDATIDEAKLIDDHWLIDQLNYNEKTRLKFAKKSRNLKVLSMLLLVVLLISVVLNSFKTPDTAWITIPAYGWWTEQPLNSRHIFTILGALAGAAALLVSSLHHFFGIEEQRKSAERMHLLYTNGNRVYEPNDGIQDHERELLEDLGREALAETGDWLLMNRKRKVEVRR